MKKVRRTVQIHNSDKIVCNYHDNGYCRFKDECKYHHFNEKCEKSACEQRSCLKRHPILCKYFRRNMCKFDQNCMFSHKMKTNGQIIYVNEEPVELNEKLKSLEDIIGTLKKEMAMKDFVINAKDITIRENEEQIKLLKKENDNLKSKLVSSNEKSEKGIQCKSCEKTLLTLADC